MKLLVPVGQRGTFIQQLNCFLPPDIRAYAITKVSKAFNAKSHCAKRRYHYLLPTYTVKQLGEINKLLLDAFEKQGRVVGAGHEGGYVEQFNTQCVGKDGLAAVKEQLVDFRLGSDQLELLRGALKAYCGTKPYHNFTSGKFPDDANAQRFIVSFDCTDPFVDERTGLEWVLLSVVGQSFLIHQIRKMVGLAVEVCRGAAPIDTIADAFTTRKVRSF